MENLSSQFQMMQLCHLLSSRGIFSLDFLKMSRTANYGLVNKVKNSSFGREVTQIFLRQSICIVTNILISTVRTLYDTTLLYMVLLFKKKKDNGMHPIPVVSAGFQMLVTLCWTNWTWCQLLSIQCLH